ncbi:hypothetical protein CSB93_0688 [Pseudomonas paraeruginosa]|uniref:Uncharacterized protein n=1 Tax=Pseudomonas paraeruginosa TaxID=2994495 RepID=A0A2R3IWC8_9PSED|nr:hypothetical protein CSB93_0688 [Pseudomonas paraeruginosa]AWE89699.1 hypothetical protein CSC28_6001 [Pseudomonas paraeruginosa]
MLKMKTAAQASMPVVKPVGRSAAPACEANDVAGIIRRWPYEGISRG